MNASAALAREFGETVKRIDGTEVPILTKWLKSDKPAAAVEQAPKTETGETAEQADSPAEAGRRPDGLDAPREGAADDLRLIKGVGPKLEQLLNSLGFWHFEQIAAWGAEELAWVDANLEGFKGRASRDDWVAQAKVLAEGGETEFSSRAEKENLYDKE